jgi:hypothetical protein
VCSTTASSSTSEPRFAALAAEIEGELTELEALGREIDRLQRRMGAGPDPLDVRAAGSILHDLYSGLERIFERIAAELDGGPPTGADRHVTLLRRMALPVDPVRPSVVSAGTAARLDDYLRFRHVFRNVYGRQLQWSRMRPLLDDAPTVLAEVAGELRGFTGWLRRLAAQA